MGVSSSLYSSISGLSTMGEAMSVLGDNVANVNTVAFKASRSTFQDVLAQSVSTAAGSAQVGRGVTLNAIDSLFAQGSFESSSTPTDMAIGGQGFFMLRAADSSAADMYTRAGEFRFDKDGALVDPVGHFAQGWTIDSATGERAGTIGDISIGKNTPPVATKSMEVIANVDSRKSNEVNEDRLFNNWNGTNAAAINPSDPIDSTKYDYTTSVKIYDSKGASHDISTYFDRTGKDNQWEFLITCDPAEDLRALDTREQAIYNPDTRYNYKNDKGAGALMYGVIQFDTGGNITSIDAYKVPPDGQVDPAKPDNRILLGAGDSYFSFPTNFTGADTNQYIKLNLGARYNGTSSAQSQILVSDSGARALASGGDITQFINSATTWSKVSDSNGNAISQGDTFIFEGWNNGSDPVTRLVYTVKPNNTVQDLLDKLDTTFGCTASIDAKGRLKLTDNTAGNSSMYVTRFETISANNSVPFGGGTTVGLTDALKTDSGITTDGSSVVTDDTQLLVGLRGTSLPAVDVNDTFTFTGTDVDGNAVNTTYTVTATSKISDLLSSMATAYGGANSLAQAVLDGNGNLRVIDVSQSGNLAASMAYNDVTGASTGANPWGLVDDAGATSLTAITSTEAQINVTTAKRMVLAPGRAFSTNTGDTTPITASTQWDSVYDDNSDPAINGGKPRGVNDGDIFKFTGTKSDGSSQTSSYTVNLTAVPPTTVQDMLYKIGKDFACDATIDSAGRLVLTDWKADTVSSQSKLSISKVETTYNYTVVAPKVAADYQEDIFGPVTIAAGPPVVGTSDYKFNVIKGDLTSEDGSEVGDTVTTSFSPEALATTQYANSSTTIFQDQDGFASGFLQSVSTDVDGVITGHYSNGQVLKKVQMALANFSNLAGLRKEGGNIFTETTDSGAPVTGAPGTNGLGSIAPNALEQSNVDLGTEFVKLITVQRGFQANSKIITTTDDMLNDLINMKR